MKRMNTTQETMIANLYLSFSWSKMSESQQLRKCSRIPTRKAQFLDSTDSIKGGLGTSTTHAGCSALSSGAAQPHHLTGL